LCAAFTDATADGAWSLVKVIAPPRLSVPDALFVSDPAPAKLVITVVVALFVIDPATVKVAEAFTVPLFVNEPATDRVLATVSVSLFVYEPVLVIVRNGIAVIVDLESVLVALVKECTAVALLVAVKVVALFVKLPPKEYALASTLLPLVASIHTAPLFGVTSPVKVIALPVPLVDARLIVPLMLVAPLTLNCRLRVALAPEFIVKAPTE
jgi:hypothetical protein